MTLINGLNIKSLLTRLRVKVEILVYISLAPLRFYRLNRLASGLDFLPSYKNKNTDLVDVENRSVLIVIPFKDKWYLTKKCIQSLARQKISAQSIKVHLELVDNNSKEQQTRAGLNGVRSSLPKQFSLSKFRDTSIFNFSKLNNDAVDRHKTSFYDYYLFLNNDIEFRSDHDLERMINSLASYDNTAIVGTTLIYPNECIQHLFVMPGMKIVGAHPFRGYRTDFTERWFKKDHIVPAVTGAAMLVKREAFEEVGGFDPNLANCYQDVDLCLKVRKLGNDVMSLGPVILTHHETATRKPVPSWDEVTYCYEKWGEKLEKDPLFPLHFSRCSEKLVPTGYKFHRFPWEKIKVNNA